MSNPAFLPPDAKVELAHLSLFRVRPRTVIGEQVTLTNIRWLATWMEQEGGGVAGLTYCETGDVFSRGIRWGTLSGSEEARIGDWIVQEPTGLFRVVLEEEFDLYYQPTEALPPVPSEAVS